MKNKQTNHYKSKLVRNHFEKHADDWQSIYSQRDLDSLNIQLRQTHILNYVDELGLEKGSLILDLGCGAGLTSIELLKRGFVVHGIDISKNMINLARSNCKKAGYHPIATYQLGSAEELNYEDAKFDAVVAMGLIEYLTWDRWALQEMHRVLKPGGYLIVTVPNKIRLSYLVDPIHLIRLFNSLAKQVVKNVSKRVVGEKIRTWHNIRRNNAKNLQKKQKVDRFTRRRYIPHHLDQMLEKIGFDLHVSVSHGFGPFRFLSRSNKITLKFHEFLQKLSVKKHIPFLNRLGSNYIVLCQKRSKRWIFTNMDKRVKTFESEYKKTFIRRNRWINKHPAYLYNDAQRVEKLIGHGETVLVLSPHPDDEIIGCGGTLIKLIKEGANVTVVQITDGSSTDALRDCPDDLSKSVRLEEAKKVAEELGSANLILWREPDAHLECSQTNIRKLSKLLDKLRPKAIFVPFINDIHPDHIAANEILGKAIEASFLDLDSVVVLSYEVWSFVPVNAFCIIDQEFDKKVHLLFKYRTGMKVVDYISFCESLNSYHAYKLLGNKGFAEAFFALDAEKYLEILKTQLKDGFNFLK